MKKLKYFIGFAIAILAVYNTPILGLQKAHAALLFVGVASSSKTTNSTSTTLSTSTTIGNLLVGVCLQTGGGSNFQTSTMTSGDGTAWTQYAIASGTSYGTMIGFYGIASSTAVVTSTCKVAAVTTDFAQWMFQYSGNATTSVLDTTSTFTTNASITSSTMTYSTTNANDVIVSMAYAGSDGSLTGVGAPFTARYTSVGLFGAGGADFITSTVQTNQTYKWTFSASPFANILGSFKAAAAVVVSGNSGANQNSMASVAGIFQFANSTLAVSNASLLVQ